MLAEYSMSVIETVLSLHPRENRFGIESFNFITVKDEASVYAPDYGYIYPAKGDFGNSGAYCSRSELESYLK